ncbi:SusC/RagA family TonB-linked outer membrane protein [uncultured Draconibacterium sp.]|uniref:SusC/RagA family TonB-linked outer membrane protein n=1 Tax=uncultured Draconibacterium sp. TaxID=1573823 RepID=UPI0032176BB1
MKKIMLLIAVVLFIGVQSLYAQTKDLSGVITSSEDGSTIPGASIMVKGTTLGTVTDIDGNFNLKVPADAKMLMISFVGMKTVEVAIGNQSTFNVTLQPDVFGIDEVIVSGVSADTPRKKLSVSVGKVGESELKEVPASSAAGALQGKMAGVTVTSSTGEPGSSSTILVRGATQISGSQSPLIIVDGVMMSGTLADINVDDIESIEVVKGASASALYGSQAGNGVVVVTTKRGKGLASGETIVTVRNEYGVNRVANSYDLSQSHAFNLADDWQSVSTYTKYAGVTYPAGYTGGYSADISGSPVLKANHYMDNPYGMYIDHQDEMFSGSEFYTNYVSVQNNTGNTNFLASFENYKHGGILFDTDGYSRNSYRMNIDHRISDKVSVSASNLFVKATQNYPGGDNKSNGGVFFNLLLTAPDVDLMAENPDGQPYQYIPDPWQATTTNPLYNLWKQEDNLERDRFLGSYALNWEIITDLKFKGEYSFENTTEINTYFAPYDTYTTSSGSPIYSEGQYYKYSSKRFSERAQANLFYSKNIGDINLRAKASYLYENEEFQSFSSTGNDFGVQKVPSFDAIKGNISSTSYQNQVVANNVFGILYMDYKDKYIFDGMYRYDGSSLFGENERWQSYYRVSGAWRISEDFKINNVQEMKLRAAYGTAGQRPPFSAQYEVMSVSNGVASKNYKGNKDLKPSRTSEVEVGLNIDFLNRFSFEAIYAKGITEDQFLQAPQASFANGWRTQWVNAGTMESQTIEASLSAQIVKSSDFSWTANIVFDRNRNKITELNIPPYQTGPEGQEANKCFYIRENETFGVMYGAHFLTSMDELANQIDFMSGTVADYTVNADGFVILAGTEGTTMEAPIKLLDEEGKMAFTKIGDSNPDFKMGFSSTLTYKDFSLYFLFDWKQGGDIYNKTAQWLTRDDRHGMMDQAGKPENEKKTIDYYKAFYDVNDFNDFWIEDGTYVKLRELSLSYNATQKTLSKVALGFLKGAKLSVIGRNLLTFTNYTGFDPEVGTTNGTQIYAYDFMGYPNFRSFSASLELKF